MNLNSGQKCPFAKVKWEEPSPLNEETLKLTEGRVDTIDDP